MTEIDGLGSVIYVFNRLFFFVVVVVVDEIVDCHGAGIEHGSLR